MFRCSQCREHAHPASAYLIGEPLCQDHLAQVGERLVRSERCRREWRKPTRPTIEVVELPNAA